MAKRRQAHAELCHVLEIYIDNQILKRKEI